MSFQPPTSNKPGIHDSTRGGGASLAKRSSELVLSTLDETQQYNGMSQGHCCHCSHGRSSVCSVCSTSRTSVTVVDIFALIVVGSG